MMTRKQALLLSEKSATLIDFYVTFRLIIKCLGFILSGLGNLITFNSFHTWIYNFQNSFKYKVLVFFFFFNVIFYSWKDCF
jgi:hypothetical protein